MSLFRTHIWLADSCLWHLLPRQNLRWHLLPGGMFRLLHGALHGIMNLNIHHLHYSHQYSRSCIIIISLIRLILRSKVWPVERPKTFYIFESWKIHTYETNISLIRLMLIMQTPIIQIIH